MIELILDSGNGTLDTIGHLLYNGYKVNVKTIYNPDGCYPNEKWKLTITKENEDEKKDK